MRHSSYVKTYEFPHSFNTNKEKSDWLLLMTKENLKVYKLKLVILIRVFEVITNNNKVRQGVLIEWMRLGRK